MGAKGYGAMTVYIVMELAPTNYPFVAAVCLEREMAEHFALTARPRRWVEPHDVARGWKIDQRQVVSA